MDGWGLGKVASADAIKNASTPFVSSLYSKYPNSTLTTCGEAVGLLQQASRQCSTLPREPPRWSRSW